MMSDSSTRVVVLVFYSNRNSIWSTLPRYIFFFFTNSCGILKFRISRAGKEKNVAHQCCPPFFVIKNLKKTTKSNRS